MVCRINKYEYTMKRTAGAEFSLLRIDGDSEQRYRVTLEMMRGLAHAAFERFSSLIELGEQDVVDVIIEQHLKATSIKETEEDN
jgi:hypothetical protein